MRYASVCDGIGAVHTWADRLGWDCAWTSEIDPFPAAVVEHHYGFANLGDMTRITDDDLRRHGPIDLLVGGTPCQSFSVAGLRKGLADPRGNLALVFLGLADRARPSWLVWENVPGVLSSATGEPPSLPPDRMGMVPGERVVVEEEYDETLDFGCFLAGLSELGYGWAYRVLDAQYVRVDGHPRAVPQRRRRVFVVGCLGDWRRAAAVLLERESLCGHPPPRRTAGEGTAADAAPSLVSSGRCVERAGETRGQDPVVAVAFTDLRGRGAEVRVNGNAAEALHCAKGMSEQQAVAHTLKGEGFDASEDGTGRGIPLVARCLNAGANGRIDFETETQIPVAAGFDLAQITSKANRTRVGGELPQPTLAKGSDPAVCFQPRIGRNGRGYAEGHAPALNGADAGATSDMRLRVATPMAVRRLLPRECERLQGFPDDYTLIQYRGKPAADGPRYRALGNSMARNVMLWIGQRIDLVREATR